MHADLKRLGPSTLAHRWAMLMEDVRCEGGLKDYQRQKLNDVCDEMKRRTDAAMALPVKA